MLQEALNALRNDPLVRASQVVPSKMQTDDDGVAREAGENEEHYIIEYDDKNVGVYYPSKVGKEYKIEKPTDGEMKSTMLPQANVIRLESQEAAAQDVAAEPKKAAVQDVGDESDEEGQGDGNGGDSSTSPPSSEIDSSSGDDVVDAPQGEFEVGDRVSACVTLPRSGVRGVSGYDLFPEKGTEEGKREPTCFHSGDRFPGAIVAKQTAFLEWVQVPAGQAKPTAEEGMHTVTPSAHSRSQGKYHEKRIVAVLRGDTKGSKKWGQNGDKMG